jgi:SAM-dependent methyltransferase
MNSTNNDSLEKELINSNLMAHRYNRDYHEPPIMREHSLAFVRFLSKYVNEGDRILDLGCASASLWPLFKELLPKSVEIVGVDISTEMLKIAQENFPDNDFRIGSMLDIPADDGSFDVVIVSSAFHHINDAVLPNSLAEVYRVLEEHGVLVGREPLMTGRIGDRGGWIAGALMHFRHLAYRLTKTKEFPEPDAGPDHHAYIASDFLTVVSNTPLSIVDVEFRNPVSLFVARCQHPFVAKLATMLDNVLSHKEGQEVHYSARKNYSSPKDVSSCVEKALQENFVDDMPKFLAYLDLASRLIHEQLDSENSESLYDLTKIKK